MLYCALKLFLFYFLQPKQLFFISMKMALRADSSPTSFKNSAHAPGGHPTHDLMEKDENIVIRTRLYLTLKVRDCNPFIWFPR